MKLILENKRYEKGPCKDYITEKLNRNQTNKFESELPNSSSGTSALVLIMQDYKDGQLTRKPNVINNEILPTANQKGFEVTSAGQKASVHSGNNESESPTTGKDYTKLRLAKKNLKHTSKALGESCHIMFKNCNVGGSTATSAIAKRQNNKSIVNRKKDHTVFKYFKVESEPKSRKQGKPTFKIQNPPTLEQKSVNQASLMGLFSSNIEKP
ncbi:unnamed protein product [Kluyveromyces dobzhanskii CBS 2104]|uniref:WGS project CCBQ000000000 data, contig 00102 n=1 Tax=Kluyveromyces dobzhanskii CBS 2104 TaxID=1427455 RepID=A0A0A8L6F7_9SACH|nr:unnamed protein product [Kluyveromyces dobzhanskii CBS 2104]